MKKRASGILLHITSLPSKHGTGDLGPQAYKFVDFLTKAKQSYWQILPLNPPTIDSPYSCTSAFAGNTSLINPELSNRDYENFKSEPNTPAYKKFCLKNKNWLDDFATFIALKKHFKTGMWCDWPSPIRDRKPQAMQTIKTQLKNDIDRQKFLQFIFFEQWTALKRYCKQRNIKIIGDIPIYLAYDSADVWANPQFFKLTKTKKPQVVSGVPPDFFSKTGQLWGNPVYDWPKLRKENYSWWFQRIKHNLDMFDMVRIDHFKGFIAYWQVPAHNKTAIKGKWVKGPSQDFFRKLFKLIPSSSIVVEDLGYITPAVKNCIKVFDLATTKVFQSAFDGNTRTNPHNFRNHVKNSIFYTGTHDTNTLLGWFQKETTTKQKKMIFDCLDGKPKKTDLNWQLIQLAAGSIANILITPMQDILGLDQKARMNLPGTVTGNWKWQLDPNQIKSKTAAKLAKITKNSNRA